YVSHHLTPDVTERVSGKLAQKYEMQSPPPLGRPPDRCMTRWTKVRPWMEECDALKQGMQCQHGNRVRRASKPSFSFLQTCWPRAVEAGAAGPVAVAPAAVRSLTMAAAEAHRFR